jgi:hypothetical protein
MKREGASMPQNQTGKFDWTGFWIRELSFTAVPVILLASAIRKGDFHPGRVAVTLMVLLALTAFNYAYGRIRSDFARVSPDHHSSSSPN